MKKELISFQLDAAVLHDMLAIFGLLPPENKGGHEKTAMPDKLKWDVITEPLNVLNPELRQKALYIKASEAIQALEDLLNRLSRLSNETEIKDTLHQALLLNEGLRLLYFSIKSGNVLDSYPLFPRWFIASTSLNISALSRDIMTCLACVSFWKDAKDYLDKITILMVSRFSAEAKEKNDSGLVIRQLNDLLVYKNYELLSSAANAVAINKNSLIKKEDLLRADDLINSVTLQLAKSPSRGK